MPARVKQADIEKALRAAKRATPERVIRIEPSGAIVILPPGGYSPAPETPSDEDHDL